MIESYFTIGVPVEEAEGWAEVLEPLLYPNINELHSPSQMYLFRRLLGFLSSGFVFEVRGEDAVDLGRALLIIYFFTVWQVHK